ncbi:hypothetical protein ACI2KR_06870 [Pseudomonas luteola]
MNLYAAKNPLFVRKVSTTIGDNGGGYVEVNFQPLGYWTDVISLRLEAKSGKRSNQNDVMDGDFLISAQIDTSSGGRSGGFDSLQVARNFNYAYSVAIGIVEETFEMIKNGATFLEVVEILQLGQISSDTKLGPVTDSAPVVIADIGNGVVAVKGMLWHSAEEAKAFLEKSYTTVTFEEREATMGEQAYWWNKYHEKGFVVHGNKPV